MDCPESVSEGRFPSRGDIGRFRKEIALQRAGRAPAVLRPALGLAWRAGARLRTGIGG